jgi:heterodisulfide reductase subunit A
MLDVGRHPNIELLAYSDVEKVAGQAGDFKVTIRRKARYVNEDRCTGCGACTEKCPVVVPDAFNEGLGTRGAVYSYFAQGIPSTHTIDAAHCRQLQGKKCGICAKKCQAEAIDFEQKDRMLDIEVGAIVIAAGYDVFDPSRISEYRYQELPNVVTAIEFERLLSASGPTAGHLDRPSDRAVEARIEDLRKQAAKAGKALKKFEKKYEQTSADFYKQYQSGDFQDEKDGGNWAQKYEAWQGLENELEALEKQAEGFSVAKKLAFIQCVGSRDLRFYPFCSGFCCMHSIKEAIIAHEHEKETTSTIFGMDIRAVGKGFDEYKVRGGKEAGIQYVRGRVAEILEDDDHNPIIVYEDTQDQQVKEVPFDLVILATACAPTKGIGKLAEILGVELNEFGFIQTSPSQPLDTTREGVFVCGCSHSPMDIPESVAQASSAAARAVQTVAEIENIRKAS